MVVGAIVVEGIILLSVYRTLGKMEKMSAVDVLYGRGSFGRKNNLYLPIGIITAAAVFMILVPWNIKSTISLSLKVVYTDSRDKVICHNEASIKKVHLIERSKK